MWVNRGNHKGLRVSQLTSPEYSLPVTRRKFLGVAGTAAVAASPALKAIEKAVMGPFEFESTRRRAVFKLGGEERWVIDTHSFTGSPRLKVTKKDDYIHLELTGAKYPGTDLPADLNCEIQRGLFGWNMKLNLALGNFMSKLSLERWLAGVETAHSPVTCTGRVCGLGNTVTLEMSGSAKAEFSPDWALHFVGSGIMKLVGLGKRIVSDYSTVSLLGPESASMMNTTVSKRTLITMERGKRRWHLKPCPYEGKDWELISDANLFDRIQIEAGESSTGKVRSALVAESGSEESKLFFKPDGRLKDREDRPFRLPLENPRYAIAFDSAGDETALVSDFSRDGVWLQTDRIGLELGSSPTAIPFELTGHNGKLERMQCEPVLLTLNAPLAGAIVEPISVNDGTRLAFMQGQTKRTQSKQAKKVGQVQVNKQLQPSLLLPASFKVSVVRPKDLLTLNFEFFNFNLKADEGQPVCLRRIDKNKPAYIVAEFPPQNIAEEAFFRVDENIPVKLPEYVTNEDPTREDPDEDSANDHFKSPPVQSRLSAPSRLAFLVPKSIEKIEYTLESLLDWGGFQQNVVSTAQPPPIYKIVSEILMSSQLLRVKSQKHVIKKAVVSGPTLEQQLTVLAPMFEDKVEPRVMSQIKDARAISDLVDPEMRSQLQQQIADEIKQIRRITPKLSDPRTASSPATFIEAPYRLLLSPNRFAGWAHSATPVESAETGRTELWHTRLGVKKGQGVDEDTSLYRKLRAVWARDFIPTQVSPGPAHLHRPFRMSLDAHDRHEIVHLTSNFEAYMTPVPIDVERFMLTPLGAWMNVHGGWMSDQLNYLNLSLEEWRHRATMGRDHYVRVVYKGYLFPFGHRASLIKITERKFRPAEEGDMQNQLVAYLTQRMYIVVRQPEMVYSSYGYTYEGREMPFKRVRITTLVTPNIEKPENSGVLNPKTQQAFWPRVAGDYFRFHMVAEDVEGQQSEFTAPLIFVDNTVAKDSTIMGTVQTEYEKSGSRRQSALVGQKVAFAERGENDIANQITRDSTFETESMKFNALIPEPSMGKDSPQFLPIMDSAVVNIPALKQLLGTSTGSEVEFHPAYEINGFSAPQNKGEIFLKLTNEFALDFSAENNGDKTGGMITPNINIQGISRILGPVSGSNNSKIVGGEFDPEEFFGDVLAEVLGGISLKEIVETIGNFSEMPKLVTEKLPNELKTRYLWKTDKLKKDPLDIFLPKDNPKASLEVETVVRVKLPKVDEDPEFDVVGSLKNFKMSLFGFIIVSFDEFKFSSKNGSKPDVDVKISQQDGVMFGGPLAFLNDLCKYIPMDGFSDPPDLEITPMGITASYSLGLPDIAFGVFSLQNISLGAGITIPFTGDPARVRFNFCERDNPFMLTVWCIGGGGFAGLALGLDGVEVVEASLEFGGSLAFSIGIGSGAVYAAAGIYFKWGILEQTGDEGVLLCGYLRVGGAVEILGLVCISIEFYMGLEYYEGTVAGEASLTITIDILIFSKSWDITVRREFEASPPPRFADMTSLGHWQTYCEAFA